MGTGPQGSGGTRGGGLSALKYLLRRVAAADEVLPRYPADHPRLLLTRGLLSALLRSFPFGLAGVVLGINAWILDRVSFRRPKDERIALLALSWIVVPAAFWLVYSSAQQAQASVLFAGEDPVIILLPGEPLLMAGAIGWRAAAKGEQRSTWAEVSPLGRRA